MKNRSLVAVLAALAAPVAWGNPQEPSGAQVPGSGGGGPSWLYLRPPLPDQAKACPDAQPAAELVRVPLFSAASSACPVADVAGDVVTALDLETALAAAHQERAEGMAGRQDATAILNRLIDVRLVVREAREMGIEELPDVSRQIASARQTAAREILKAQVIQDVKADPVRVDRIYKDAVREWKLRSVLFQKESEAKAFAAAVAKGKSFDAAAKQAVAEKKAIGGEEGQYVHGSKLLPNLLAEIRTAKAGAVLKPLRVQEGWTVIQVEAVRYPDDPAARATAEATSRGEQQKKALAAYYAGLVKRFAKVDEKLLGKIDYEAKKPGLEALRKDKRLLASIEGEPPITVGDLTAKVEEQFYHGIKTAIEQRKVNKAKGPAFDSLLSPRVVALEAKRLGVDKTPEYARRVAAAEDQLLFGTFVEKAVIPDVKVPEDDVKKYYESHKADFTYPAFYRMESIGFASQKNAEAAVAKLRSGTDYKWLNANAEGKLPEGKGADAPKGLISGKAMPPALLKALDGAKSGDYRVYAPSPEQSYVVHLIEAIPSKEQPYAEARATVGQKLYGEAIQKALQDYVAKLRKAHKVQVFLVRIGS